MRILLLFAILLAGCQVGQAQIQVYLKNGEMHEGNIGKFATAYVTAVKSFKLKKGEKGKYKKFKAKDTDSVICYVDGQKVIYHSIRGMYGKPNFYLLYERGKVNIYEGSVTSVTGYGAFTSTFFYFKRKHEERIANLDKGGPYWSNFAKVAGEYYSDCPELVSKIQNREEHFTNKDQLNVAQFYNRHCN